MTSAPTPVISQEAARTDKEAGPHFFSFRNVPLWISGLLMVVFAVLALLHLQQ